ncbi:hypothetical protein [Streptomyces sp. NPDC093261]|uniref:hypothetical protein n=1 Tax=Streptomyces sp. NPDC093261 TaxID=3366037 RepID=UPI00380CD36D
MPDSPSARYEVVIDRDPDNDTGIHLFVDGVPVPLHTTEDFAFHVVDPGRSGADAEWVRSMYEVADGFSPAAGAAIRELTDSYA